MIMKFYLTATLLFTCLLCAGQKQITNFDNRIDPNGLAITYRGTINGKLLFSAFSPKTGKELWVSDGTTTRTRLLKDITPGNGDSNPYDFTNSGGRIYFIVNNNELWRTDGSSAGTSMVLRSDSTLNLHRINNRLLASFRNWSTGRIAFAWVGEVGQADFLAGDATTFTVDAGKLYYAVCDTAAKKWELKVYDRQLHTLYSQTGDALTAIRVENFRGFEYFSVRASYEQHTFLVADTSRAGAARRYEWGSGPAPAMLRDSVGGLFLVDDGRSVGNNRPLKLYRVVEGNNWETLADIESSMLYAQTPVGNEGPFFTNFILSGDKLAFTTLYGYESVYQSYLNVFDFRNNRKKVSSKLPWEINARDIRIKAKGNDSFELSTGTVECTYDMATDKVVSLKTIPPATTSVTVGNRKFELTDNVYVVAGGVRKPLLAPGPIFANRGGTYRDTLNGRMLFWTNDEQTGTGKVWASDGNKTQALLEYTGTCHFWNSSALPGRMGGSIVFTSVAPDGYRVYKTDGTAEGSAELYFGKTTMPPYVEKVLANENQVAIEVRWQYQSAVVVTDLTNTAAVDITKFTYHSIKATSRNIYVLNDSVKGNWAYQYIYKVDAGQLKPLELNKGGEDAIYPQFAGDRIYFTLRNSSGMLHDVCYTLEGSEGVRRIYTGAVSNAYLTGEYLIAPGPGDEQGLQDMQLFEAATSRPVASLEKMYPVQVQSGKVMGLWGPFNAVLIDGTTVSKFTFTDAVDYLREVPDGMLIKLKAVAGPSWHLYNRATHKVTAIFKNEDLDFISGGPAGELLFGSTTDGARQVIWQSAQGKRTNLEPGYIVYKVLNGSLLLAVKNGNYEHKSIYSIGRNTLVEHYRVNYWSDVMLAGSSNYTIVSTEGTGEELARVEQDSLRRLPEIVKGPEGIILQEVFEFKSDVFATAFTYSKGLQVWKLNALPDDTEPEKEDEIKVDTPELPGRVASLPDHMLLNAYPNPVIRELNIDLKDSGLVRVVDAQGLEVMKGAAGKMHTLDMKDLPAGVYVVLYAGPGGNVSKKVVKR